MTDYFVAKERNVLFRRIEQLAPDLRSDDRHLTGHQLLCHLNDELRSLCGLQPVEPSTSFFPLAVRKTVFKWLVFHVTPWTEPAPKTEEAKARFVGRKPAASFEQDHDEFVALLQTFEAHAEAGTLQPHPEYGVLSKQDWGRYLFLHMDYHLNAFNIQGDFRALK
jgi:hypothetical protein